MFALPAGVDRPRTLKEGAGGYTPEGKDTGLVKPKGTNRIRAHENLETVPLRSRKPEWLKVRSPGGPNYLHLKKKMRSQSLHTVCEEAGCPNIGECWESGTATFMILGDVCTRACKYCGVAHGMPTELDEDEPRRVAETCEAMELEHVVITSVNRVELPDGGAGIYAETIRQIHELNPGTEALLAFMRGEREEGLPFAPPFLKVEGRVVSQSALCSHLVACREGLVPFYESVGFERSDDLVDHPDGDPERLVRMRAVFDE